MGAAECWLQQNLCKKEWNKNKLKAEMITQNKKLQSALNRHRNGECADTATPLLDDTDIKECMTRSHFPPTTFVSKFKNFGPTKQRADGSTWNCVL